MTKPVSYKRHRFPSQIIAHAVWLYFRFPLSLRLPLNSTCVTVHRGNGVDVLGDTSTAELALVVGGTREGCCIRSAG
jgi:hypothetical protein